MHVFQGYTVYEQTGETLHSVTYKARKDVLGEEVIIRVLKAEQASPADIARLKHEYELIRSIKVDGIVNVIDIIESEHMIALVMEDFPAAPLSELMKNGIALERFLDLAVRAAKILGDIHNGNVTHRNLKPSNILYHAEKEALKLTDFGIASEITRRNDEVYNTEVIEKTLPYLSPEQTGRMNCAVDYRTDLYSLGVTFYEMLTGSTPFTAGDPLELIHAHIAKAPVPPHEVNPQVPAAVSGIVMKLLAKTPDERYQNSYGLMADLKDCLDQLEKTGRIEPFELARHDLSLKFNIPQVLVGREHELEILFKSFERVSNGYVEILLVTGEPGIGKSALVGEVSNPIVGKRGYFISGKYDQLRRSVPYSAIIQAFHGLAGQLLTESEERIQEWRKKLYAALGPNGKIITDIIPEIELIVGRQPDIPEIGPEETQNRFHLVFKNFVKVFADGSHPLVLFLDDIQWADSASLNLIRAIATDRSLTHVLIIGAYRNSEVAAHDPLMLMVEEIGKKGVALGEITLSALKEEDVNGLIANFFRCEPAVSAPLS
ncbi:MAG TPA: AAA family ATPase, partial [Deltaproteobacteria bacterium]|nr:AAA family ATPase [Deltaproteobacteria bacterium]